VELSSAAVGRGVVALASPGARVGVRAEELSGAADGEGTVEFPSTGAIEGDPTVVLSAMTVGTVGAVGSTGEGVEMITITLEPAGAAVGEVKGSVEFASAGATVGDRMVVFSGANVGVVAGSVGAPSTGGGAMGDETVEFPCCSVGERVTGVALGAVAGVGSTGDREEMMTMRGENVGSPGVGTTKGAAGAEGSLGGPVGALQSSVWNVQSTLPPEQLHIVASTHRV